MTNWTTVTGGSYQFWTVNAGVLTIGQTSGTPTVCSLQVNEVNANQAIVVAPNPSQGTTTIKVADASLASSVIVYNTLGQIMLEQSNLFGDKLTLDISALPVATYYLEVQ